MSEDDLHHCYMIVDTLWLGGIQSHIRPESRVRPTPLDIVLLAEWLATLIERQWLKVQNMPTASATMRSPTSVVDPFAEKTPWNVAVAASVRAESSLILGSHLRRLRFVGVPRRRSSASRGCGLCSSVDRPAGVRAGRVAVE
jgi:hypothetical protein